MNRRLAHLWAESDGQLYPAIRELIIDELITVDPQDGPRHRTPLRITEHGLTTLAESLRESPKPDTPRDELALSISLLHERIDPSLFRHLDDELQRCLRIADTERAYLGAPDRYTLQVIGTAANWLARRWVVLLHEARAAWCREAITLLRELAHPELNPLHTDPEEGARPTTPLRELAHPELHPLDADPEPGVRPSTPLGMNGDCSHPDPEEEGSTPPSPRPQRIDMLTLLEMVENGEPIPPWNW